MHTIRNLAVKEAIEKFDGQPEVVTFVRDTIDTIVTYFQEELDRREDIIAQYKKLVEDLREDHRKQVVTINEKL